MSDARPEILDDFLAWWEPVVELPAEAHVILDTERPLEENVQRLRQALPTWPAGVR